MRRYRTQEVAGSSPASSIQEVPANRHIPTCLLSLALRRRRPPGRLSARLAPCMEMRRGPFPEGPSSLREPEVQDIGMSTLSIT